MKFYKGILKPYQTLRNLKPSIYYLEEFCYKMLPIRVDRNRNIYVEEDNVTSEGVITLNFPEFLDVSTNLDLVKSIHYAFDVTIRDATIGDVMAKGTTMIRGHSYEIPPFPEGMIKVFFGYRYTVVRDPNKLLRETQSLCCKRLAELSDDCFVWVGVDNLKLKTTKPTVCKYKAEINLELLLKWLEGFTGVGIPEAVNLLSGKNDLVVNLIFHPPYQGRMSFKDNLKILYPNKTVKLKNVEKITFRTNRSYTVNNKLYEVSFIDKDTDQVLFKYNSGVNPEMFFSSVNQVDTTQINSYMDEEVVTFDDGVVVDFKIPSATQSFLGGHKNYKIRVTARDLTTQNRG